MNITTHKYLKKIRFNIHEQAATSLSTCYKGMFALNDNKKVSSYRVQYLVIRIAQSTVHKKCPKPKHSNNCLKLSINVYMK